MGDLYANITKPLISACKIGYKERSWFQLDANNRCGSQNNDMYLSQFHQRHLPINDLNTGDQKIWHKKIQIWNNQRPKWPSHSTVMSQVLAAIVKKYLNYGRGMTTGEWHCSKLKQILLFHQGTLRKGACLILKHRPHLSIFLRIFFHTTAATTTWPNCLHMGTAICVSCTQLGSIIYSKLASVLKVYLKDQRMNP